MSRRKEPGPVLLALSSSALLLPAYQLARADAAPETSEIGVRLSSYEEDDTRAGKTFGGRTERYEVDIAQFRLLTPLGDDWSLALDMQREDMSGASPWFTGLSEDGRVKVAMSSASIEDTRTDASVTTRYYFDRGNAGLNFSYSDEDDYQSRALGFDVSFNSRDGLITYTAAASASDDELEPTQGTHQTNVTEADKDIYSGFLGLSHVISKVAIARLGIGFTRRDGYLTDPYKRYDSRPDEREEWVLSGGYRHFFASANAALHADYRYFDDDWGIKAHTLELGWHQNIGYSSQLIPYLRYYSQEEADFFSVIADTTQRYHSDDYRLSAFGAVTAGLRVATDIGDWRFTVSGERYRADNDWGLYGGDEAPALLRYYRFTVGLDYRFE